MGKEFNALIDVGNSEENQRELPVSGDDMTIKETPERVEEGLKDNEIVVLIEQVS